jgi:hypothetical protein
MEFSFLYRRVSNIIINPEREWAAISGGDHSVNYIRNNFVLPLTALVAVAAFIGTFIFRNPGLNIMYAVLAGVKYFLLLLAVVYLSSVILKEITYSMDLGRSFGISFRLIIYSLVPFFLCQMLSRIFESLIFINILAFYGLLIFWVGMEKTLALPDHKKIPLLVITSASVLILVIALNLILKAVTDKVYFAFFS